MSRVFAQRAVVVIVAVLAVAWLAISYGNSDKIESASFVAGAPKSTPAQIAAALHDARSAGTLNPAKTDALAVEAALDLHRKRPLAAASVLEEMTRLEPDAREPWFLLAQILGTQDPRRAADAREHLKRLDPLEARRRHP